MKAVIFDIGNVLIHWDVRALYRKILPNEAAIDRFLAETRLLDANLEFDRGQPYAGGLAALATAHPHYASELAAFDARWEETVTGAIDGSVAILEELRAAEVPLYALTNFSSEKWPLTLARFPFLGGFRDVLVSGHERMVKPDPAIYRRLLDRNALDPADCIFIDDSPANVCGAQAVGIDAILFDGANALRAALRQRGLPLRNTDKSGPTKD